MRWFKVFAFGVAGLGLALPAAADDLRAAAQSTTACRAIEDMSSRLACFDRESLALAEALAVDDTVSDTVADTLADPVPDAVAETQPEAPPEPDEPSWAAAPPPPPAPRVEEAAAAREEDNEPREIEVVIVRITVNGVGRHKFYTEDGAVWEQTIIEEIRPPRSLPAVAELKQRAFGNPTIKFDVSNRAYRVRRLE